jgi:diadenosine tetraphosphate (Ap4A) HIT family hydrolase
MPPSCPFCNPPAERIIEQTPLALAIPDKFPVSRGHTLIVTRRHVGSFFETTADERADLLRLLDHAQETLVAEFRPDGFNIGINDGRVAGQTIPHLHIHLIPRYSGDRTDPRGGVRWVNPDKARYWDD